MDKNIIYNADCLDSVEGMARLPDNSVDLVLCDLPYGTTEYAWDSVLPLPELWVNYKRIIKKNGIIALTCNQPFTSVLGSSNLEMLRYEWLWVKNKTVGFLTAKKRPLKKHETILIFSKGVCTNNQFLDSSCFARYNPQGVVVSNKKLKSKKLVKSAVFTARGNMNKEYTQEYTKYPSSVLEFDCVKGKQLHPTQKPVALFEYLIKTYTNEGDTVLDNCMGSGTTAIACMRTGRNYIGWEKDSDYYKIIQDRIQKEIECFSLFNK